MSCPYPEHHSSGGGWGGPIAAIFTAMIAAVVLGPLLQFPGRQQSPAVQGGGQHLHLHLDGMTPAERAEVMRQLRGG